MTKQTSTTAVEWLENQYIKHSGNLLKMKKSFEQAKRMEDEQRLEAWNGGIDSTEAGGKSYDQYYNETFKK